LWCFPQGEHRPGETAKKRTNDECRAVIGISLRAGHMQTPLSPCLVRATLKSFDIIAPASTLAAWRLSAIIKSRAILRH
jgi:hypothetical protein